METFFIIGLPRTRTAWLANLFTTGQSHCFHEWFSENKPETVEDAFSGLNKQYVGNSDCGNVFFYELIKTKFPDSKIVIVHRPMVESLVAAVRAIKDADPYLTFKAIQDAQQKIETIDGGTALNVMFSQLHREETIEQIWRHCLPSLQFDRDRFKLLDKLKVTVNYTSFASKRRKLCPGL